MTKENWRKFRILKRLKNNYVNKKKIYGFDVETFQVRKEGYIQQDFLMGSVVRDDDIKVFWNRKEMADYLTSRKFRGTKIFASNLEFDFQHIFQNLKHLNKMFFIDKNGLIYIKYNQEDDKKKNTHNVEFLDTYNFTGKMSVANMGKLLGIEKFPQPKAFKRKPQTQEERIEMIKYNIRDSLISQKFAEFLQNFCNNMKCKMKITIASTGLDYWRRHFQPIDIFQEKRYMIEKHFEGSYHGGRTEMFKRGLIKKAFYFDFNSHYPSCCYDGIDGKGSYPNPSSARYIKNVSEDYLKFEGITKASVDAPNMYAQLLGVSIDNKYMFPYGKFTGWFTNIELRKALKIGYKIDKFYEGIYYLNNFVPFRNCIRKLFSLRRKYQRDRNEPMQKMIKVLMNAGLYGKFAQKIDTKTNMYSTDNLYCEEDGRGYVLKDGKKIYLEKYLIRGNYIYEHIKAPMRIPVFLNPILASYTTALARIKLFDYLIKYPNDLIYCDTDSVIMKRNLFNSSTKLGELALEHRVKEAVFVRPKFYFLRTDKGRYIFRSKGVGKFINSIEAFNNTLKTKNVHTERFTKIKESAIRKLPFSSIIDVNKNINLEDDKRVWEEKFSTIKEQNSEPLNITI